MKIRLLLMCLLFCGCSETIHDYHFETLDDAFLCMDYLFEEKGNIFTGYTIEPLNIRVIMEDYDNCIAQLPYPVNFVEKEKDGTKICYDKNNKIELPILYCQKDHNG